MDGNDRLDGTEPTNQDSSSSDGAMSPAASRIQVTDGSHEEPTNRSDNELGVGTKIFDPREEIKRVEITPRTDDIDVVPKPVMMEETIVDSEREPTTQGTSPTPDSVTTGQTQIGTAEVAATATISQPTTDASKKRMIYLVAGAVALIIIAGLAWWFMMTSKNELSTARTEDLSSAPIQQAKLGIAITVADGIVESSSDGLDWQAATSNTQLKEGDQLRTGLDSRAVLTLDDGSAVRLDADTIIVLEKLSANEVIVQQTSGMVYSRVVPSSRKYTVAANETKYQALGTAFVTINTESEKGVQVYQSSVKVGDSAESVTEGNQFYKKSSDAGLQEKITEINLDALVDNSFVNWNLTQDESDANFKLKLGMLPKIKERSEKLKQDREAEAARQLQSEKDAAEKAAKAQEEAEKKKNEQKTGEKVTRGSMSLWQKNGGFEWSYAGKAIHGYKLVYLKGIGQPEFGKNEAIYFNDPMNTKGSIPGKGKISDGTYSVRVCAYTANTENEPCVDYSNTVTIKIK